MPYRKAWGNAIHQMELYVKFTESLYKNWKLEAKSSYITMMEELRRFNISYLIVHLTMIWDKRYRDYNSPTRNNNIITKSLLHDCKNTETKKEKKLQLWKKARKLKKTKTNKMKTQERWRNKREERRIYEGKAEVKGYRYIFPGVSLHHTMTLPWHISTKIHWV